jgi:MerR family transcriptional regulator, repressor of the yfmOP operon
MTTHVSEPTFRIGEVAGRVGVTTRTIRYYEELGMLGTTSVRGKGEHRLYDETDVIRLQELLRLRDLLGLKLEEIVALAEAEEARAALRHRWESDPDDAERARIIDAAMPLVERQLALVRTRQQTLAEFAGELTEKLQRMRALRSTLPSVSD